MTPTCWSPAPYGRGTASQLVDALLKGDAMWCVSEPLFAELADVLHREKFRARLGQSGQAATTIVARFREVGHAVEPPAINVPAELRDPDDIHVLACAVGAGADLIVTGDHDLHALQAFAGIPIVDIREALQRMGREAK